ncbi:MAG: DUF3280 domain-containing protein [Steroidobacter sp.]
MLHPRARRPRRLMVAAVLAVAIDLFAADAAPASLAVLDIELTGDLGGPELKEQHAVRARTASAHLRSELARTHLYVVVENSPARELIERLASVQYLHKCNGCESDIARRLDAQQVLVAWIHRVSNLILTLNYEIRDVQTGETLTRSSFSFRGDNDAAWTRAVEYLVRDLEERSRARE